MSLHRPVISVSAHKRDRGSIVNSVVDRFERNLPFLAFLIIVALVLLPGIQSLPLLDRDEPRFSRATVEMMENGNWVVPYFNDEYRFDKPPLTYWWMALHYHWFGETELGARFHSLIATFVVAVAIWGLGCRMFDPGRATVAAIAWLTCVQVFQHGRLALADMPMIASIAIAHWAMYRLWVDPEKPKLKWVWWTVLYVALALGFLAKGPLAWLCPALTIVFFRFVFWRRPTELSSWRPWPGVLLSLGLVALWGVPALIMTNGLFWDRGIGDHVVDRGVEAFNDRKFSPWFYLLTAPLSFFPWFPRLIAEWRQTMRTWNAEKAFLLSWAVAPYLIFTFYATQLPHYTLPAFPALFLLGFSNDRPAKYPWIASLIRAVYVIVALVLLGVGYLALVPSSPGPSREFAWALIWFSLIPFGLCLFGHFRIRRQYFVSYIALALVGVSAHFFSIQARELGVARQVGQRIVTGVAEGELRGAGFREPSLVFYSDRPWKFSRLEPEGLEALIADPPAAVLALRRESELFSSLASETWKRLGLKEPEPERDNSEILGEVEFPRGYIHAPYAGINFARPSWVELDLWYLPTDESTDSSDGSRPDSASRDDPSNEPPER